MFNSLPRLIIYTEDIPLKLEVPSSGVSKALYETFTCLFGLNSFVCCCQTHQYFHRSKSILPNHCILTDYPFYIVSKIISIIPIYFRLPFLFLQSLYICCCFKLSFHRKLPQNQTSLFAVIGTDINSLVRAFIVSYFLGIKFAPYLLDDIYSIVKSNKKIIGQHS